jgi:CheY-like chemotaxis protein
MVGEFTTALKPARPQPDLLPQELDVVVYYNYVAERREVSLRRRRTTFGRGDADVVIEDPTVSRKHFQIEVVRGSVVLHDLASANGTIYRGRWITSVNLRDGDHFQVGNTRFHVVIRTTNLFPARLLALVALTGEEAGALAGLLDSEIFAVRANDPNTILETCRFELPDLLIIDASPKALTAIENLKRLPRLRHIRVVCLLGEQDEELAERCRGSGADYILQRPVSAETLQDISSEVALKPQSREITFPVNIRSEETGEANGRLVSLDVRGARLQVMSGTRPSPASTVTMRLLLPNEYGVVIARGLWQENEGGEAAIAFTHFEGNGQIQVRRVVRDAPASDASLLKPVQRP